MINLNWFQYHLYIQKRMSMVKDLAKNDHALQIAPIKGSYMVYFILKNW